MTEKSKQFFNNCDLRGSIAQDIKVFVFFSCSEHVKISVPYHVHTVHHHHIQKYPVYKKIEVPVIKEVKVPFPVHVPVKVP